MAGCARRHGRGGGGEGGLHLQGIADEVLAQQGLAQACGAEGVQCIGTKFVLYRRNDREPKIELPRDSKKK